jgi:hypothetical protein
MGSASLMNIRFAHYLSKYFSRDFKTHVITYRESSYISSDISYAQLQSLELNHDYGL